MISNVLALEPVRTLHHGGKPDRAEVEAAIRTIIRWSGDNPDREGLIETPARVTRALRRHSSVTLKIPRRPCKSRSMRSKGMTRW
jgi:GTP cyclohydrolase I